jgi:hypothetical protein
MTDLPTANPSHTGWVTAPHGARVSAVVLLAALQLAGTPIGAAAQTGAANSKKFEWTAPGDDGTRGRASRYELRYSATAINDLADSTTLQNWWSALSTTVPGMPLQSQAGVAAPLG